MMGWFKIFSIWYRITNESAEQICRWRLYTLLLFDLKWHVTLLWGFLLRISYIWFFFHCSQVSTNILRKYIGPVDIWFSILDAMQHSGEVIHCLLNEHPQKSFLAMAQHSSQWVWYVFILVFSPEEGNLFCHEMFSTKVISVYLFPFSNVLPCFWLSSWDLH